MSFPPYASYKDSGVEWLGKVPSHWKVQRLKLSAESCRNGIWGQEADGGPDDIPCVRVADFDRVRLGVKLDEPTIRSIGQREREGRLLCAGDLLLEKSGGGEKQPVGAVVLYAHPEPAVCSNFVARMRLARAMHPRFWTYVHSAAYAVRLTDRSINQTSGIQNLDQSAYFEERAPYPPLEEQAAIADFLDRETAKIDALVEAQRRLIALLKEKRQAVISHAVTKGLDPSAPLKPSGIEWLGDVPAHWEFRRIKFVADMESGHTPDRKIAAYWENCTIPWVSLHDTAYLKDHDYIEETAQYVNELGIQNSSARLLPERAVVFSRDATIGRCAITSRSMAVSQHFIAWLCSPALSPEFLLFTLRSMQGELERLSSGATLKTIGMPDVRALAMAVPPKEEQATIVLEVRRQTRTLDNLVESAQSGMVLLQERRAALISAAVTGKIDVRGWTAKQVRNAVGAEIVHLHARDRTFGRVQNQKLLFLAQHHAEVEEIGGRFQRKAAGPHDADLMVSIEQALTAEGVLQVAQAGGSGSQVTYIVAAGTRPDRSRLRAMLGDQRLAKLNHMLKVLADEDTRGVESVATLYGVWNDALLDGETPDDERLIRGFMDWHPEKAIKFKADDVRNRIGFMRRNGLVPEGRGSRTQVGALL